MCCNSNVLKTVCRPTVFEGDPVTVIYRMCHIGLPVYRVAWVPVLVFLNWERLYGVTLLGLFVLWLLTYQYFTTFM